jgi:DNA-binding transcriptional LysR family regulator
MNSQQVRCFLAAAKLENFTKAAEHLHLTQPALSRSIVTFEQEIGTPLFVRARNTVRLTNAGRVLAKGLEPLSERYRQLVKSALKAAQGVSGTLNIGTAVGQSVPEIISDTLLYFWRNNSDLQVQIGYFNLSHHVPALLDGEVDLIVIAKDELSGYEAELECKTIRTGKACIAVPASHPLADKKDVKLADFKGETFICIDPKESAEIAAMQRTLCEAFGFIPTQHPAPNIGTVAVWLDMGIGITTLITWHMLSSSPGIRLIETDELEDLSEVIAWRKDNENPAIPAFIEAIFVVK